MTIPINTKKELDIINYNAIQEKLSKWRQERHLTIQMQRDNFNSLFNEEYDELIRAITKLDNNTSSCTTTLSDKVYNSILNYKYTIDIIDSLCDMIVVAINAGYSRNELIRHGTDNELFRLDITINNLLQYIEKLNFNPYLCMNETIKEISSRTGKWNGTKWIKDKVQKNLYKANYLDCYDKVPP